MMYFDYAATTPVAPEVYEAMAPYFCRDFFNASGLYQGGRAAHAAMERARDQLAALLDCRPEDLTFTSGGTEADNLAVTGTALAALENKNPRRRVLCSAVEHHAVLESCEALKRLGFQPEILPVDGYGRVLPETLAKALGSDVLLVSVMWVNNELGTIEDIPALAKLAHQSGAIFHTDAVQALATQNVDVTACGADLLTVSAHKIYGPTGAGALWVRPGTPIRAVQHGGQQERRLRGGTENVPAIVGFGAAAELLQGRREQDAAELLARRTRLLARLRRPGVRINSPAEGFAPGVLNAAFLDAEAEGMLFMLDREGYCLSMGSACNSQSVEPSHVIRAIGLPEEYARGCVRVSFGRGQTDEMIDLLAGRLLALAEQMRR
jgi:cysteine desulfurase